MEFLLVTLIIVVAALVVVLGSVMKHITLMSKQGKSATAVHFKSAEIEDLLAKGMTTAARNAAIEWRFSRPRSTSANMLLAKAHFQLGELVEAKIVLEELVEFSPDQEFAARSFLHRIAQSLRKQLPRVVE